MTSRIKFLRPFLAATGALIVVGCATHGRLWKWIPASYTKLEQAERRLLESSLHDVPFEMTKVANLGTVIVPCTDQLRRQDAKHLVLIHGFAGGNPLWTSTLKDLARHYNVYAVEWIGVGRSDRPDFPYKDYDSADKFVVGKFEEWRQEMNLPKINLLAHSMGAIFASSYALSYPDNVSHLVLVSPAGVGPSTPPAQPSTRKQSWFGSFIRNMVISAWENGYTPMSIVRGAGPYGPQMMQNVLMKRISFVSEQSAMRDGLINLEDLGEYTYHNWALKPSGERAMSTHLAPIATSRRPLMDTLLPERVKMPISFIYGGQNDWMDYRHGVRVVEKLKQAGHNANLHLVSYAGHQVFLDNPHEFSNTVINCLQE